MSDSNIHKGYVSNTTNLISAFEDLLYGDGDPFDIGCSRSDFESIYHRWANKNRHKGLCAVTNWQWWDIEMSQDYCHDSATGLPPAVIFAEHVVSDLLNHYSQGDSVRTSPIVAIHDNCVAETKNNYYLLVGPGRRKSARLEIIFSITF